jgi:RIO-like serine/threonine protein kinase
MSSVLMQQKITPVLQKDVDFVIIYFYKKVIIKKTIVSKEWGYDASWKIKFLMFCGRISNLKV